MIEDGHIEVLHERSSDGGCAISIFVDGVLQDSALVDVVDVDPGRGYTREEWEEAQEYIRSGTHSPSFREAALYAYDGASGTYIDNEDWVCLTLEITNIYVEDGEEIVTHEERWMPPPPYVDYADMDDDERDELDAWAEEHILPLTGTGRTEGDASYFAKVTGIDGDHIEPGHPLIGYEFEWGV